MRSTPSDSRWSLLRFDGIAAGSRFLWSRALFHEKPGSTFSQRALGPLRDILYHTKFAQTFVEGFDRAAFRNDLRTVFAVTRCLEIVSEASRRLPHSLKERRPSIAWKRMAGAGNVYRHDYEDVAADFVWDTVQNELPSLRLVIEQELRDLGKAR